MMDDNERHFASDSELGLSRRFREDLGELFTPDRPIPAHVDRAVAEAARGHFPQPQRRRWKLRWTAPAAAAAAILIGVCLWWLNTNPATQTAHDGHPPALVVAAAPADIDENGKVDILDAFTLARRIESKQPLNAAWDFNRDGLVDRRDVDTVALAAVRLDTNKGV